MKQFLHLMKLEWKMDLWLCMGYPILIGLYHYFNSDFGINRPYISEIDIFGYSNITPYFFILFFILFLTPWTSIFVTPNMRERLQTQEWVFTLPIPNETIFHRGWMRTMIVLLIVVAIPFLKISKEKDAQIKLYMNTEDHPETKLSEVQIYFPNAELKAIQREDESKNYPHIIIKNGTLDSRLMAVMIEVCSFSIYLNFIFWMIQRASRQKVLKWIYFGILGLMILAPFTMFFMKWKFDFGNPYQILALFVEYQIPIAILTLSFIFLTYVRGLKIYSLREIE